MKKVLFFVCLSASVYSEVTLAQTPAVLWAKGIGGRGYDQNMDIACDHSGNVYTIGAFSDTADFDPGPGVYNMISTAPNSAYILKLNAFGNLVWAKKLDSGENPAANSLAIDHAGNLYITGYYTGTVDFDPNAGVFNLTAAGMRDIFVLKLDSSGNFIWAKSMGGTADDFGFAVAVNDSGNLYCAGHFQGTADFNPGPGTFYLTSAGSSDIYVTKLDTSGNFQWARRMGGTGTEYCNGIAVDAASNVYTTGYFQGTADFDPGAGVYNLVSAGGQDIFISKLDASGNFAWAAGIGGVNDDDGNAIKTDAFGNVYTIGNFKGTMDFDPGAGVYNLSSGTYTGIFILKLDASGNFTWARAMVGAAGAGIGYGLAFDAASAVYSTGYLSGTIDFDPGTGVYNLTSGIAPSAVYVQKLDAAGNFQWAKASVSITNDNAKSITLDAQGNVYASGMFGSHIIFDSDTIYGAGDFDSYIIRINSSQQCSVPVLQASNITFSNLTSNSVTVHWTNGNGSRRIVKIKPANSFTVPVNGNDYTFNSNYSGSGEQVVYNGTGNSVNVTGLASNTFYWFRVYEANCSSSYSYYLSAIALNNPRRIFTPPYQNPNRPEAENSLEDETSILQIYPNPAHNTFTISLNQELGTGNLELGIYDVTGRVVQEQKIDSQLSTFHFQLASGVYFVKVQAGEKVYTEKLVVE